MFLLLRSPKIEGNLQLVHKAARKSVGLHFQVRVLEYGTFSESGHIHFHVSGGKCIPQINTEIRELRTFEL